MPDPNAVADLPGFFHVRIIISLITGLSVTRILAGLSRFVQSPEHHQVHAPHLAWSCFLLLYVIHFWWFEFALQSVPRWQIQDFLFIVGYASLIFFTASLLYPDRMDRHAGFAEYFQARQVWFYTFLAAIFVVDIADTFLKGWPHVRSLGWEYPARQALLIGIACAGILTTRPSVHLSLAIVAILTQVFWMGTYYRFLD